MSVSVSQVLKEFSDTIKATYSQDTADSMNVLDSVSLELNQNRLLSSDVLYGKVDPPQPTDRVPGPPDDPSGYEPPTYVYATVVDGVVAEPKYVGWIYKTYRDYPTFTPTLRYVFPSEGTHYNEEETSLEQIIPLSPTMTIIPEQLFGNGDSRESIDPSCLLEIPLPCIPEWPCMLCADDVDPKRTEPGRSIIRIPEIPKGMMEVHTPNCVHCHSFGGVLPDTLYYLGPNVVYTTDKIPASLGHHCLSLPVAGLDNSLVVIEEGVTRIGGNAGAALKFSNTLRVLENFDSTNYIDNFNTENLLAFFGDTFTAGTTSVGADLVLPYKLIIAYDQKKPRLLSKLIKLTINNNSQGIWTNNTLLSEVTLGDKVTTIKDNQFSGCSSLKTVYGDADLISIGDNSYANTALSTHPKITSKCLYIGENAFQGTKLSALDWDLSGVKYLGRSAFEGCGMLENITIPGKIKVLPSRAFKDCSALSTVTWSDSVKVIGESAFENCSELTSKLPSGLGHVGRNAFKNCSSITGSVEVSGDIMDCAFEGCSSIQDVSIGGKIKIIASEAFKDCSALRSVVIDSTEDTGLGMIGLNAFSGCALETVHIKCPVTLIHADAFADMTNLSSFTLDNTVESIGNRAFKNCTGLTAVDFSKVMEINKSAFENSGISGRLVIPKNVRFIGSRAFADCKNITEIEIEDVSITCMAEDAFDGCDSLDRIIINNGASDYLSITVGDNVEIENAFIASCPNYNGRLLLPQGITSVSHGAFIDCLAGVGLLDSGVDLTGVDSIGRSSFCNAGVSGSQLIPQTVKTLGVTAFKNNPAMTAVTFEEGFDGSLGGYAFSVCDNLETVNIPSSMTSLPEGAFFLDATLANVNISDDQCKLAHIGPRAFAYCSSLKTLILPSSIETLGEGVFSDSGLSRVLCKFNKDTVDWNNDYLGVPRDCEVIFDYKEEEDRGE